MIKTKGITKEYGAGLGQKRIKALDRLDLEIKEGEIFGVLGPNGAGKTTTIKILVGLMRPTSGTAQIFGKDCNNTKVRSKLGFLAESPYFYEYLTASEFLAFYGQLFDLSKNEIKQRSSALLKQVGLESSANLQLRKFSKGMLQRIGIAQALINNPALVILDEPMSGLDPIGRKEMRELILSLKAQGKTIFFSSHIIHDVEVICDRVGILVNGKLLAVGQIDEITQEKETLEESFIRIVQEVSA
ncbi:MAG: ABC transporter ATP-binding protein [Nitrospirae bacterium]|nr:ABC transporter ATP-binding protein [Candidatus Troglogloeales bacterium]